MSLLSERLRDALDAGNKEGLKISRPELGRHCEVSKTAISLLPKKHTPLARGTYPTTPLLPSLAPLIKT